LMTWAGGFDVYLVGLIQLPRLVAENKDMYPTFVQVHFFSSVALLVLTVLHVAAGLYHRMAIGDKFGVWARMAFRFHRGS
jgi:cytochrome b561